MHKMPALVTLLNRQPSYIAYCPENLLLYLGSSIENPVFILVSTQSVEFTGGFGIFSKAPLLPAGVASELLMRSPVDMV